MKRNLKIPRELLVQKPYSNMTNQAKALYAVLLDLKEQAVENDWIDGRGYRYVLFPKKNMQRFFNCSRYNVDKYTRELEVMGLIRFEYARTPVYERRIYVRSFGPGTDFISLGSGFSVERAGSENTSHHKTEEHKDNGTKGVEENHGGEKKVDTGAQKEKQEKDLKYSSQLDCPVSKEDVIKLTLRNIRLMTCVLEKMMGELYESKE